MKKDIEDELKINLNKSYVKIEKNPMSVLHHIGKLAPSSCVEKKLTPEEKFKKILLNQIDKQLYYIDCDITNTPIQTPARRWYSKKKQQYFCAIKYQNRNFVLGNNGETAFIAKDLKEVKSIYENIKKEIESNQSFLQFLFDKISTMNIARGAAYKINQ